MPVQVDPIQQRSTTIDIADYDRLWYAAACVANAIQVGLCGPIQGSLMEKDLRDALGLMPGELVNITKPAADKS